METMLASAGLYYGKNMLKRKIYKGTTLYAVRDILAALGVEGDLIAYWKELKKQLDSEGFDIYCELIAFDFDEGRFECTDKRTIFRIIQSIDSPQAEQFKQWFADLAEESLAEYVNPALAIERATDRYIELGYSPEWIKTRIQSIATHTQLLDEWSTRGANTKDHEKLYNTLNKETFGVTVQEHKDLKKVSEGSLRDNMSAMELAVITLGELTASELHKNNNSHGIDELNKDAVEGGRAASFAKEQIEQTLGKPILTCKNASNFTQPLLTTKDNAPK